MNQRSRSTLFLLEQLIVVAVFAVCAAACVKILTSAFFTANETRDINNAVRAAESGAECFDAVRGDSERAAQILGGSAVAGRDGDTGVIVYYDENWNVCGEDGAQYMMLLPGDGIADGAEPLVEGELSVKKTTGEVILAFTLATRGAVQ